MAKEKVDENFEVLEWKINNFCLWNREIHEPSLEQWYFGLHVFPRGLEGNGERLIVQVYDISASFVEVSYIGSDGSLLFKQEINDPKWEDGFVELSPGPKFEEVVESRKKNPDLKDTLTILCRLKKDKVAWYRGETDLVALDICFRVSTKTLEDITFGKPKLLSNIGYPFFDEGDSFIELFAGLKKSVTGVTKIIFSLKAGYETEKLLIHTFSSLRDADNVIVKHQENDHVFNSLLEEWTFSDTFQKKKVVDNNFSLYIHLKVVTGVVVKSQIYSISLEENCAEVVTPPSEKERITKSPNAIGSVDILSKELMCLYQDQDYADFHLHCGNVTFGTHRGILSARSPVFKSMLSSGMKEAESGYMEITDLDVNTLGKFLAFLYSGAVQDLQWENAIKLYYCADKYEVPSLRDECRSVLISSISTSNVCRVLSLANTHQDDVLLSVSQEFLLENDHEVLKSEEWQNFMMEEPYLASQTATDILLKKSKTTYRMK